MYKTLSVGNVKYSPPNHLQVWATLKPGKEGILNWRPVYQEDYTGTLYRDIKWSVGAIKYADHQGLWVKVQLRLVLRFVKSL